MQEQATYLNEAVNFLLKKYPNSKQVPLLGHSMGGIVARLMMLKENHTKGSVDTIITLSSPHAYPPVPLESGVEDVYRQINSKWEEQAKDTLLISLSGGILDNQLSSEPASLSLARIWHQNTSLSAFTSSLPALWSGVDHLAMMWCDQLRERIARGVLRIEGGRKTVTERREEWRRMIGIEVGEDEKRPVALSGETSSNTASNTPTTTYSVADAHLGHYEAFELITSLAVGLDNSFGPPIDQEAQIRVDLCSGNAEYTLVCRHVSPSEYNLYPPSPPSPLKEEPSSFPPFPRAEERYEVPGHGIRRLRFSLDQLKRERITHVKVETKEEGGSHQVVAGWTRPSTTVNGYPSFGADLMVPLPKGTGAPAKEVIVPDMDNSLLAYDISMLAHLDFKSPCQDTFAPLLQVKSLSTGDTQYYPTVTPESRYHLTLHSTSPYMPPAKSPRRGTKFALLLDTCDRYYGLSVKVNWRTSAGLLISRYRTVIGSFPLAVLVFISSHMWDEWDQGGETRSTSILCFSF